MQGFCGSIPALADLERQLTEQGKYDEFKRKFEDDLGRVGLNQEVSLISSKILS
jgi:hypothetical protein